MTRLAFRPGLIAEPLVYGIRKNLFQHPFRIEMLPEEKIADLCNKGELDLGLISPLQFAMKQGELRILKDFAILSPYSARNALLYFKDNLKNINRIGYADKPEAQYLNFFGQMVLSELFDIQADWQVVEDILPLETSLSNNPVLYLTGQDAFDTYGYFPNFIDLSQEWILKTELPLVHQIMVVNSSFDDNGEIEALKLSRELGIRNLKKIALLYEQTYPQNWVSYFELINENYQYFPEVSAWDSLRELLPYMFYYGKTEYFPELKFY